MKKKKCFKIFFQKVVKMLQNFQRLMKNWDLEKPYFWRFVKAHFGRKIWEITNSFHILHIPKNSLYLEKSKANFWASYGELLPKLQGVRKAEDELSLESHGKEGEEGEEINDPDPSSDEDSAEEDEEESSQEDSD